MAALYIFIVTCGIYSVLTGILFYVWHKFGKGEPAVAVVRVIYILGSLVLLLYMITL
ncbi:MAG: hypothetical protein RLZZ308_399 [Candidatus Parcubacteria bacterium]|jgi:hypothetical protein